MLTQLSIQNFGLIDRLSIDFSESLNILTGSTGAGKSIIIDGLRFALGERIKSSQIRDKDNPCVIEVVFDLMTQDLREDPLFKDFLSDEDHSLIINRQYLPDGRTKIKINGFSVTVAQLKAVGNHLIDFHGPHDHQMLLSEELHIGILDQLVDFSDALLEYSERYEKYIGLQNQWKELKSMAQSRERDIDLLGHQIRELEQVPLSKNHYEQVCQDLVKIDNAEKLYDCVSSLLRVFEGEDTGLSETIRQAFGPMRTLNEIDDKMAHLNDQLTNVQDSTDQIILELKDYMENLSFQPDEAQEINHSYDIYEDIKRKYGPGIEEAEKFYIEAKAKYDLLMNLEHNDTELQNQIEAAQKDLKKIARKLTTARKKTADSLKGTIENELKDLGIEHVAFEARIESVDFHARGQDHVVFYISPNAGEDLKPLAEIVSSGEAARLMLALKRALTNVDPIPVLIFDEIDAQIGGRLGTITGNKLKELSTDRQVLLITHLPQIASFSDRHFKVNKNVVNGRTITTVDLLDEKAKVQELAHMMTGDQKNKISLAHAEDMLSSAQKN